MSERLLTLTTKCRAFGDGAITIYVYISGLSGARMHVLPGKEANSLPLSYHDPIAYLNFKILQIVIALLKSFDSLFL